MPRTDLYLKIKLEHASDEKPEQMASEICRQVQKIYGVRSAEVSSLVPENE